MNRDSLPALIQRSLFFLAGLLSAAGSAADGGHLDTPTVSEALPKASFSCNANLLRNTPDSRFTASEPVSGEPVVSDSATGLTWKKCTQGLSGSGCANGSALAMSWSDAISAANSETFAGFSDWRLPSVQELNSIVETACRPFLNNTFFPDTSTIAGAIHYWTGTTFSLNPTGAYRIDFSAGYLGWDLKTELHYVRLLRGGLAGSQFDAGKDYTPDSFSFAAQTPVPLSSGRLSASASLSGLSTVTGIRVGGAAGSEYSINGGTFTSAPGWVSNGDQIVLRHTSAATRGATTTSTIFVGPLSADFVSITEDVPGAPTALAASAGNASATVAFTAPSSNGGYPISSYTATSSPGGLSSSGCTASPCSVTGLSNGTSYTFTVTASNQIGNSAASAPSNSVTPMTVPDPPIIGTAVAGNAAASISFTAPTNNGGNTISGYTATSSPGGLNSSGCTASPCSVTGLSNGTAYTFTVTATNAAGTSAASSASNSVTPATVPDAPTIGIATAGNASATIAFSAPASNGGSAISGYTATSSPGALSSSGCIASPCSVTGLSNGTAYTFTVSATNAAGNSTASAPSNSVTPQAPQSISFVNLPNLSVGNTGSLSASGGDSGNPVLFSSLSTGVCSVAGNQVTGLTAGNCTIAANQAGNASFSAAPQVTQLLTVAKGEQSALSLLASPSSTTIGGTSSLSTSGGSGSGAVGYAIISGVQSCSLSGSLVTALAAGDCSIRATKSGDSNYNSAEATTQVRVFAGPGVDLSLTLSRTQPTSKGLRDVMDKGNVLVNYRATVRNNGPIDVVGVRLQANTANTLTNLLWSCSVPGATCTPPSGSTTIDTLFDLRVGQTATANLSGQINPMVNFVEIAAQAMPPAGVTAALSSDDRQVMVEPANSTAVFRNGME